MPQPSKAKPVRWLRKPPCAAEGCRFPQEIDDVCRRHWWRHLAGEAFELRPPGRHWRDAKSRTYRRRSPKAGP